MGEVVAVVPAILQLLNLLVIGFVFAIQRSTVEGTPGAVHQRPFTSNATSPDSQPYGSNSRSPEMLPPLISAPEPQTITGSLPPHSSSTLTPIVTSPLSTSPSPLFFQGHVPSLLPSIPIVSPAHDKTGSHSHSPPALPPLMPVPGNQAVGGLVPSYSHITPTIAPKNRTAPPSFMPPYHTAPPPLTLPYKTSPTPPYIASPPLIFQGHVPSSSPNIPIVSPPHSIAPPPLSAQRHVQPMPHNASRRKEPVRKPGVSVPSAPAATPSSNFPQISPVIHASTPEGSPSPAHERNTLLDGAPAPRPIASGPNVPHSSALSPNIDRGKDAIPVAAPPNGTPKLPSPGDHSPTKDAAPSAPKAIRHSKDAPVLPPSPHKSPLNEGPNAPASSPSIPFHKQHHAGPISPPSLLPTTGHTHYAPSPHRPGSTSQHPFPNPVTHVHPAPSPSPTAASGWTKMPVLSPKVSPSGSSSKRPKMPPPVQALPPPPPNEDCSTTVCTEPYTNTPPGSPCGCVLPMQVGLRLSIALYTFFPLVSELAQEIASGVFMKQSQVRIIGANAASQEPEKTIVLIDLVPLGKQFDNTTAFLMYQRFWHKEVVIKASFFGDYEVLYVRYQGLPSSPPIAPMGIGIIDDGPHSGNNNNARAIKPLGVDVGKRQHKDGLGGGMIAVIALSVSVALVLCSAVAWVFLCTKRECGSQPAPTVQSIPTSVAKPSGTGGSMMGSGISSASLSFGSSMATYTGSAKTFSISDLERATNNFDSSRILGEGGFGRVYSGILEDGTKVAVKILKRDDQQGGREFLAEIEMLSRLHHRNLVNLIGICTEEGARSLVYELIPNGSVESHLHGVDKESAPLDWDARIKIALGAARGLAYLHEDSSPRVIHRDFKASNILLEHDFTPKVSDFGLARTAMDEPGKHISTRVMGTFGYVAPEYAMTGHLLVKSDVYSYGVVLLELLSGRKPVDMSQPPGQENLVAWARPLLTSKEGLETIVDPSLGPNVPFDSVAKVAAIASMCVQTEVSHRPFMGEVVQALKLVCNECDEAKEVGSRSSSQDVSADMDAGVSTRSGKLPDPFQIQTVVPHYDSEPDIERGLSMPDLFGTSARYQRKASGSFKRCSSSGQLTTRKDRPLWQRLRGLTGGSVSEHAVIFRLRPGSL